MSRGEGIIIVLIIAFTAMLSSTIAVSLSRQFTCSQFVGGELINNKCAVVINPTKLKLIGGNDEK